MTGKRYFKNLKSMQNEHCHEEAKDEGEMQSLLNQTLSNVRGQDNEDDDWELKK